MRYRMSAKFPKQSHRAETRDGDFFEYARSRDCPPKVDPPLAETYGLLGVPHKVGA